MARTRVNLYQKSSCPSKPWRTLTQFEEHEVRGSEARSSAFSNRGEHALSLQAERVEGADTSSSEGEALEPAHQAPMEKQQMATL